MTGTVSGITAYQWYVGGRWHVMSPDCSRVFSPIPVRNWGEAGPGSCCVVDAASLGQRRGCRTVVPISVQPWRDGSRSWSLSERSHGEPAWFDLN